MGTWITLAIVIFIVGSIMALKPSARETRLDKLRMTARKVGLQPKLVVCPDWLSVTGDPLNKGKSMMAQYGLVIDGASMSPCDYQVIDGQWRPYTGNYPANFALDNQVIDLPASIAPFVKGLSFKANFVCLYWQENIGIATPQNKTALETSENDLIQLTSQLQHYASLVQHG